MAEAAAPILAVEGLSVSYATPYARLFALDDVSLAIPRGEVLGLVGESGSGKSTVVLAALGLLGEAASVSARRAEFDGRDLLADAAALRGRRIGVVFQDPAAALNPALSIGLQVAEPMLTHQRLPRTEAYARAAALLGELGIPRVAEIMQAYPHQLSGGMKQRAMIAAALAGEPELLLLDEPTTALDVTIEAQILDLLEGLRASRGLSMLLVSHNLGIVGRLCDRLTILYAGRTVETGPTAAVLAAPRHPYTRGLLGALPRPEARARRLLPIPGALPDLRSPDPGCNFRPRCPLAVAACAEPQAMLPAGPARRVRCHRHALVADLPLLLDPVAPSRPSAAAPLVDVEGLTRGFGGPTLLRRRRTRVHAVDGMSLTIHPGEIVGLVGESGCGKSTLARLILRLLPADGGRLAFDGRPVPERPDLAFRRRAQIVLQNPDGSLNPRRTVEAILRRPLAHFGLAQGAAAGREVARLLELVRLPEAYRSRYPHQLSGGEKQRVGIARALATRPDFLVCDEAVSALDVSVQAAVLNLLQDLRDTLGVAYLFISHDIGVIAHIADTIVVMYRGHAMERGPADAVLHAPHHPYTEALLSAGAARQMRLVDTAPSGAGCRFAGACPRKLGAICDIEPPPWREASAGHRILCHIPVEQLARPGLRPGPAGARRPQTP